MVHWYPTSTNVRQIYNLSSYQIKNNIVPIQRSETCVYLILKATNGILLDIKKDMDKIFGFTSDHTSNRNFSEAKDPIYRNYLLFCSHDCCCACCRDRFL